MHAYMSLTGVCITMLWYAFSMSHLYAMYATDVMDVVEVMYAIHPMYVMYLFMYAGMHSCRIYVG